MDKQPPTAVDTANIINSTIYDTEDLRKILSICAYHSTEFNRTVRGAKCGIKIRYMNDLFVRPTSRITTTEKCKLHAKVISKYYWQSYDYAEVAIVRPAKIQVNALIWLADAGDSEMLNLPSVVVRDVVTSVCAPGRFDSTEPAIRAYKDVKAKGLHIRMHRKPKGRKLYTLSNLQKKIDAKADHLDSLYREIERAESSIAHARSRIPDALSALAEARENFRKSKERFDKK